MAGERRIPGSEGFTLIESMIAMFFILFIVSQIAMISIYAQYSSILARRITHANLLADEALEKSRNTAYSNIQLPMDFDGDANPDETCTMAGTVATCTSSIESLYTRVRVVTTLPAGTALNMSNQSDIDVTVTFGDAKGNPQQIKVSTVVTRY